MCGTDPSTEAIGRLGHARSFVMLTNCLGDADYALRIAAVKGLRGLGRPLQAEWLKPMILRAAKTSGPGMTRWTCCECMVATRPRRGVSSVKNQLSGENRRTDFLLREF